MGCSDVKVEPSDMLVGKWNHPTTYVYYNPTYIREFRADGTWAVEFNSVGMNYYTGTWAYTDSNRNRIAITKDDGSVNEDDISFSGSDEVTIGLYTYVRL